VARNVSDMSLTSVSPSNNIFVPNAETMLIGRRGEPCSSKYIEPTSKTKKGGHVRKRLNIKDIIRYVVVVHNSYTFV
jgi:hypothetical protein